MHFAGDLRPLGDKEVLLWQTLATTRLIAAKPCNLTTLRHPCGDLDFVVLKAGTLLSLEK